MWCYESRLGEVELRIVHYADILVPNIRLKILNPTISTKKTVVIILLSIVVEPRSSPFRVTAIPSRYWDFKVMSTLLHWKIVTRVENFELRNYR